MTTKYRLYRNDRAGGPIDYTTPIADTALLTFADSAVPQPSDSRYHVRAYDDVTGLEERNLDAIARLVIDAAGANVTSRPNAPRRLTARPMAAGGLRVDWLYNPAGQGAAPTTFKVWVTAGGSVNYGAAPAATVAYTGAAEYVAELPAATLADGATYSVGVRASNAAGDEPNADAVQVTGDALGPTAVLNLAAVAVGGF